MSLDIVLFLLRIASALMLLVILGAIFVVIWKDFRATVEAVQSQNRSYGQLVALQEIDGNYVILGDTHPLLPRTRLGRSPTNDIVISDTFASGEHAHIILRDGQWWLEDNQSRNGTTLNEMPVSQAIIIADGDVIGIGHMRYRLELE